ncbi:hypothetical protein HPP92_028582 [Vanilla planifolia]|uniref:Uncharacterized protein n=1 Tax=Vanilla planifolia TaxID=51239 RepID=A0A835P762_VANPL|nr:hypothetical protein HPP92_028582 [Vanilla planifolia]
MVKGWLDCFRKKTEATDCPILIITTVQTLESKDKVADPRHEISFHKNKEWGKVEAPHRYGSLLASDSHLPFLRNNRANNTRWTPPKRPRMEQWGRKGGGSVKPPPTPRAAFNSPLVALAAS